MSDTLLDCRGLPCPQPVLKCKKCLEAESPNGITVTVDNAPAQENVSRFLAGKGYEVDVVADGDCWTVRGTHSPRPSEDGGKNQAVQDGECEVCRVMSDEELQAIERREVVFIATEFLGNGDDALGGKLMLNFLATLPELGSSLWRIVLVNGGVKLACQANPCLEKIQAMAESGVEVLVCGTCLDHFGLLDDKRVGETTNMLDVVTSLQLASKVIKV